MLGYIFAFITLLCWTLAVRNFAVASTLFPPALVNKFRLLLACLLLYLVLIIFLGKSPLSVFYDLGLMQWLFLGLSGIVGLAIGDYFAFSAFSIIGAARTSLLSTFAPIAALIGGMAILHEELNAFGFIGIGVTLAAVIYTIQSRKGETTNESRKKSYRKGLIAGVMAAITQGLGLVLTKLGSQPKNTVSVQCETWIQHLFSIHQKNPFSAAVISPVHATFIRIFIGFLAIMLIDIFRSKNSDFVKPFLKNKNGTLYVLLGTLFGPVLGVSFSIAAIELIPVGIAQTIFSLLPITVMLYGGIFKKEQASKTAWIAALMAVLGVLILIWRDDLMSLLS